LLSSRTIEREPIRAAAIVFALLLGPLAVGCTSAPDGSVTVASSSPPSSSGTRDAVRLALSGFEQGPDRARLDRITPDAAAELMAIAQDTGEQRFHRQRALRALALYPGDRTRDFLAARLARGDEELGFFLLPDALDALAPADAQLAAPYASHEALTVRAAAARALARRTPTR
jgi:hypothetical protein